MFTDEPSAQQTPLPTEPPVFPEVRLNEFGEPISPIQKENTRWYNLVIAIGTWIMSMVLLVFVPVIIALPYFIYVWRTRGMPRPEVLATDKSLLFISILGIIPTHVLTLLVVWGVVTRGKFRRRPFWRAIGFEWPRFAHSRVEWPRSIDPIVDTLACALIAVVLFVIGALVTSVWGGSKTQLDLLVESSLPARFATAFVAVFTAPLVEELVYRGVLYTAVEQALGKVIGIISISLLFAGVHVIQYQNNISVIVVITLLSFTLTLMRAYTGKLLPSFVVHFVFNGIQSVIIVLAPFFGWGS